MTPKIPLWINLLQALILAILLFQTYACYLDPGLIYPGIRIEGLPASKAINVLGGRNAVMALISIIALVWQEPRFYSFAFLMHSAREAQDMFITPLHTPDTTVALILFAVFLFVFVIPEIIATRMLWRFANGKP